jgi:hypothetical protein
MTDEPDEEPAAGNADGQAPIVPPISGPASGPVPADLPASERVPASGPDNLDPPWWGARSWISAAWREGGRRRRVALTLAGVAAAALLGAFLFGAWHVVVGGLVRGNWTAAAFGFALCGVAGALLWVGAWLTGRLLR